MTTPTPTTTPTPPTDQIDEKDPWWKIERALIRANVGTIIDEELGDILLQAIGAMRELKLQEDLKEVLQKRKA